MTKKVFALDTRPGIQRDGTIFDKEYYTDGKWVRFQKFGGEFARPRKMGGYREIVNSLAGPSRGIFVVVRNLFNNIYSGYNDGLQLIPVNNNGVGSGIQDYTFGGPILTITLIDGGTGYANATYTNVPLIYSTSGTGIGARATIVVSGTAVTSVTITSGGIRYVKGEFLTAAAANLGGSGSGLSIQIATIDSPFTASDQNSWQFDTFTDTVGYQTNLLLAHPSRDLEDIDSEINTRLLCGPLTGTILWAAGLFAVDNCTTTNATNTVTLTEINPKIASGQVVKGYGIAAGTTVTAIVGTTITLSANATASSTTTLTFDNEVSISGGVISLHPYVFVYGNDGLIQNCSAGDIDDWVSADANRVNAATGKILQGLPVRGGSNSPSGLFWSLDSLVRVSFNPQTLGVPGTGNFAAPTYWRYDILTSQSSFLSSSAVIEYDGIYFWTGVDRFLLYNGVTKEIPNTFNQNYFFDNLNYNQRQKVWATKVPRFGEVWWFYPRGDATECTDCVIYNVRDNTWYDTGQALGSQRSAGYFSQVFRFPVQAGYEVNTADAINLVTISNAGSGYANATYSYEPLTGGTGTGANATITVIGGSVRTVVINDRGGGYTVGDVLTATLDGIGTGLEITVQSLIQQMSLWQHETGKDEIKGASVLAIESSFTTSDLGVVAGGPATFSPVGENKWTRIERVEPNFIQVGNLDLYIVGRPYADEVDQITGPYTFAPGTGKIDMKEQRRILRLKFVSNVAGGDFQVGKIIVDADTGDVRGYST
ncbi:MAG: hypothetical protein EBS18_01355 [Actinobacteria bacterium]|nr:hypothetical protein [Actinomycetota bacterium]